MGRKSTLDDRAIFAAAGTEIAYRGGLTLQGLAQATGISMGSLYHRFGSREALLAEAWLYAVRLFQAGFLTALRDAATITAGERAALETPRFCRAEPDAAIILACCRKAEFLNDGFSGVLSNEISAANEEVVEEIRRFAGRIARPLLNCQLALTAYPLAAVRIFVPHNPVPASIDREIAKAYRAALSD